jgi:ribonuclease D
MPVPEFPAPVLITRPEALRNMVSLLVQEPAVAVDTESNSLHAYREQVCLVQFSAPQTDFLVDPLALHDLSPLAGLFADASIQKVFHAADYDILCLKRDFSFEFANLFDTMVAARILGRPAVGLGAVLTEEFGIQLDKRQQRANWGQRPLPAYLLDYARLDTHYLIPLRDRLLPELQRQGVASLAQEDFLRLCRMNGHSSEEREVDCWRVRGASDLSPQQAAVLNELCHYRDQVARSLNRPWFKVLNDQTLIDIAFDLPLDFSALARVPGMNPGQIRRHGTGLLEAVRRGLAAEPLYPPRYPRPDEAYLQRLDALRNWRKQAALEKGVPSDVILPRDLLTELAERNPRREEDMQAILQDVPWRMEHFGSQILNVLRRL